ncbi:hypothetical protein PsYK624_092930 [Phanerochaete sordida]|uniref:Calcium uniporter protein, mitochondrial n=1 Tax=Phanerochaete sordida TaxID=48140 RepID=A0A9P3GF05_9APHY|nr:hypothetical protein PsYK624_092930 [Phanerochaete sordida]
MCASIRFNSNLAARKADNEAENVNVGHSRFLAESSRHSKWTDDSKVPTGTGGPDEGSDFDVLQDGKGKLSPTSSHLFKLILPLDRLQLDGKAVGGPPTVFLLHPSQPLSHISRLIVSSLGASKSPSISFTSATPRGRQLQWSESTDLGDFIRDAARAKQFELHVKEADVEKSLSVEVPSFADRTRFLRRKLEAVEQELQSMEEIKRQCDMEAHRGARRMAVGGLAMLVVYWGTVARLTFWDLGWDVMEPVTYLSGLSMVILGYLWFLYQGREVSYSSVLDRSVSSRRQALYGTRGFDIERWADLITEAKSLRKEISKIAEDYDESRWKERVDEREQAEERARKDVEEIKHAARESDKGSGGTPSQTPPSGHSSDA